MINRMPSAIALPLAYDVCPLAAEATGLSLEILRRGFLALDDHVQLDVGRAIKRHLRERLVEGLDGASPPAAATPYEAPARRHGHQSR